MEQWFKSSWDEYWEEVERREMEKEEMERKEIEAERKLEEMRGN